MLKPHHAPNSRAGWIVWLLEELTHLHAYVQRLEARPAFMKGTTS